MIGIDDWQTAAGQSVESHGEVAGRVEESYNLDVHRIILLRIILLRVIFVTGYFCIGQCIEHRQSRCLGCTICEQNRSLGNRSVPKNVSIKLRDTYTGEQS